MVDCVKGWTKGYLSNACKGGYPPEVFRFSKSSYIATAQSYPYKKKANQECLQSKKMLFPKIKVPGFVGKKL